LRAVRLNEDTKITAEGPAEHQTAVFVVALGDQVRGWRRLSGSPQEQEESDC
jgi:hypothetical protein